MTKIDTPLSVAISLDIDPDANSAVEGRHDALSSPIEYGEIRVDACKKGLQKILELLEKYDIDATLFYEARTAQMLIEDGMYLNEKSIDESIGKAKEILAKIFKREIKGFRAPYTRINRTVVKVLERLGFQYDSSETVTLGTGWAGKPYLLEAFDSSLLELALPSFRDAKGKKMSSYLWAIFEGRRVFSEYIDAVVQARDMAKQGLFVFSIHPWHFYVDYRGNQFSNNQVRKNIENLESIFSQLKQMLGIQILQI